MPLQYLSNGNDDGTSLSQSATQKTGDHGVVSAQIANITLVSGTPAGSNTTMLNDLETAVNAIIAALTNKGTVAAS